MKIKSILPLTFLLLFTFSSVAQIEDFNLSDYRMPDVENHLLDLNFSLNQQNTTNTNLNPSSGTNESSFFTGILDANYYGFKNSLDWQKELSIQSSFFNTVVDDSSPSTNNSSKNNTLRLRSYIETVQRRYFKQNTFFEIDHTFSVQYQRNKSKNQFGGSSTDRKNSDRTIAGFMPLKYGLGRIENVGDAQHAIFILDALRKNGVVNRDLTSAEIIDFATIISELKNTRFFDARIRKIAELKTLDTFLKSKDYISEREIEYFTTLNDIWIFGDNRNRKSGNRFSIVVYPGVSFNRTNGSGFFTRYTSLAYNLHGGLEYVYEKPINQVWQSTFSSYLYLGVVTGKFGTDDSPDTDVNIPKFNMGFTKTVGFYPNTRTTFEYRFNANYDSFLNRINRNINKLGLDGKRVTLSSDLSLEYFISPRFSVNISSQVYFIKFYTNETQLFLDPAFLIFAGFPNCDNNACNDFLLQKQFQQFRFKIAFDYNLF